MSLIFLEALGAMVLLICIVWWTMFAGRARGELRGAEHPPDTQSGEAGAQSELDVITASAPLEAPIPSANPRR